MSMVRRQRYRTRSSNEPAGLGKEEEKKPEFFAAAKEKGKVDDKAPVFFAPKAPAAPAMVPGEGGDGAEGDIDGPAALEAEAEAATEVEPAALAPEVQEVEDGSEATELVPPKKEEDDEAEP